MLRKFYLLFGLSGLLFYAYADRVVYAENFKVGVIVPLTGKLSEYGDSIQAGIRLAVNNIEKTNIDYIFEDTSYDARSAVSSFNKLRLVDKVDLIYVWGVVYCKAVAPLAEAFRMPTVGQCIDPESSKDKTYFIRFQSSSTDHMNLQAKKLAEKGVRKISIIVSDNSYVLEIQRALKENLNGLEIIDTDIVDIKDSDFRSLIARYKRKDIQAVGVFLMPGQISAFFKQARQSSFNSLFFGTNLFESPSEVFSSDGTIKGAVYVVNKTEQLFLDKLKENKINIGQTSFAGLAFDFASLVSQLNSANKLSGDQLLSAFKSITNGKGEASGSYLVRHSAEEGTYFDFELVEKTL